MNSVTRRLVGMLTARAPRLFPAIAALAVAGCAFTGGSDITNPVQRNLTWFNYLNAGDIRAKCVEGGPDYYRFVLNSGYGVHVRAYDLIGRPDGGEAVIRAFGDDVPGGTLSASDPMGPWRGVVVRQPVPPETVDRLREALVADGATGRPPIGKELASDTVFWIADLCLDGRFHYNAWPAGVGDDPRLSFPDVLREIDRTGVAWPDPRRMEMYPYNLNVDDDDPDNRFNVSVTGDGIAANALAIR
ncbi:MAG: hypothetical protein WD270_05120 [Acetobacterales bacterium]